MSASLKLVSTLLYRNAGSCSSLIRQKFPQRHDYGTWALSGFNLSNAARIQPVLDVEKVIANEHLYIDAIEKRKIKNPPNPKDVCDLFVEAKKLYLHKTEVAKRKEENAAAVLAAKEKNDEKELKELKVKGRELREQNRLAINKFNVINDKLVNLVLSLPNVLDPVTPVKETEILRDMDPPQGVERWRFPSEPFWRIARPGVGPQEQFAYGGAAWLELDLAATCQMHLLKQGFVETGNVDFVRRILLEGACLDPNQFLRIRENNQKAGLAHATYLVGGASFPAFLALFAQTVIYAQDLLPIKYFVIGRTYAKPTEGSTTRTVQSSAVQVFVACKTEEQQEEEYWKLAGFMENFYARTIGLSFQTRLLCASELRTYEKKKLAFVLNDRHKEIGDLTTVGDYVSKRLLCCYADQHRVPKFLHMVTGQFFDLTGFLNPELPVVVPQQQPTSIVATKPAKVGDEDQKPKRIRGWKVPPPGQEPYQPKPQSADSSKSETTATSTSTTEAKKE